MEREQQRHERKKNMRKKSKRQKKSTGSFYNKQLNNQ